MGKEKRTRRDQLGELCLRSWVCIRRQAGPNITETRRLDLDIQTIATLYKPGGRRTRGRSRRHFEGFANQAPQALRDVERSSLGYSIHHALCTEQVTVQDKKGSLVTK